MTIHDELLSEIKHFIGKHRMSKSAFGKLAMADYGFVFDLEAGRSLQLKSVEKVRGFMKGFKRNKAKV